MGFVYCLNEDCERISCLDCKKEIQKIEEDYSENEEEYKKTDLFEAHF